MTRAHNNYKPTILLLVDRRQSRTARMLKSAGYNIITTFTPDHAVAICVNNKVQAVVLDQPHFIETEGWSVAKSLKMIRANICVVLVMRGRLLTHDLPDGVDALIADHDDHGLVETLDRMVRPSDPVPAE
jgi:PleD family two-component response regulator